MASDLYATANGLRVTSASIAVPYYGIPAGDIALASDATLPPTFDLVIGNLTWRMSVLRQRAFAGSTQARIVGGGGGWGKLVPARAYQNPNGVPLASILRDVSLEVGEVAFLAAPRTVGLFYAREAAPAERVLRQLAGTIWYVDTAGLTVVGERVPKKIKSAATVADLDGALGWVTVATEDPASWLPGATYTSTTVPGGLTVSAVRYAMGDDGKLRLKVLTVDGVIAGGSVTPDNVTARDRTMVALRSLMRSEDPGRVPGGGPWEYQIERADAATFDGSPTSQDFPLPALVGVPYAPALAGTSCVPAPGTLAYVDFVNRDPTRPMLRGFGTTLPTDIAINATSAIVLAGGGPAVARVGDSAGMLYVQVMTSPAPPILWYSTTTSPPYAWLPVLAVPLTPPDPTTPGTPIVIDTGSAKVTSG